MNPEVIAVLIPIVAIVFGVAAGMLATWAAHRRKEQFLQQVHKERMAAIERGIPIPELPRGLFDQNEQPTVARSLRTGIIMLLIAVILYFAIDSVGASEVALFGLIPGAVGIGNLFYARMLHRQSKNAEPKP
jgi:Ca2+/H+ antiporter